MNERGKIYNFERAAQLRDFSELRYGTITPSDIDAFMDFGGKAYVIVEAKVTGVNVPRGQQLLLERIADALVKSGARCIVLVAEHDTPIGQQINVGACRVAFVRLPPMGWRPPLRPIQVREAVDEFLRWCGLQEYVNRGAA